MICSAPLGVIGQRQRAQLQHPHQVLVSMRALVPAGEGGQAIVGQRVPALEVLVDAGSPGLVAQVIAQDPGQVRDQA